MFLRESKQKRADGATVTHMQFAESVWNKTTQRADTRIVYNFGRADDPAVRARLRTLARSILRRVAPEEILQERPDWKLLDAWPYGDLYVLEQLWQQIGMPERLPALTRDDTRRSLPVERACFAMVANRCCAPASKLYCYEQWLREDVRLLGGAALELHPLYRSMDFFEQHKATLEKELFFRIADLFACDVELIFYDTTTLHGEIDWEDAGGAENVTVQGSQLAGSKTYPALRQRGKAKNKRNDVPQVVVGLAMTRDGLPVRSWLFRGDTVDVTTVAQVKADLRGWKLTRTVFVGDAGMVSEANLQLLAQGGGKYILCMPVKAGNEVSEAVLSRPGRYHVVAPNLEVKEVVVGDGERRRRYVVCYNGEEATRQQAHRAQILAELEAVLPDLQREGRHSQRVCALRASGRYGQYLTQDRHGRLALDPAKVRQAERRDGKFVVHSNDDTLTPADLALGYKQLAQVERAWRLLKSGLRIRPIFHWAPHRIAAHVSLTMVALLLERLAETACGDTWRNIRDDLRQIKLAQLLTPQGELWQVTDTLPAAANRLKQLKLPSPPPVLKVDPPPTHTAPWA
ncbi:MAG: IS1634 family transposase [Chloroflexi bacterium]|nr:IS1634 family transposase [Chloroflexota bacterium]